MVEKNFFTQVISIYVFLVFCATALLIPQPASSWVIVQDDFSYTGPPDPIKWFIPDYLDGWGEATCDGTALVLHTWPTGNPDDWSHIYVFSERNLDAQNNTGITITYTISDAAFTEPGQGQLAWTEVGFMPSVMINPINDHYWNMGVWCVVSQDSSLPGVYQIGMQDVGGTGVPDWTGTLPVTITVEILPNIGGVGGTARCYIQGVPGVWHEIQYGRQWYPSDPFTEDFTDARAFMFLGSQFDASMDGYTSYDSISVDFPGELPQLNSIVLSDTDSGSEQYSNSLTVSVASDVEYPAQVAYIRFSESTDFTGALWLPYSNPVDATFSTPGDGIRTLYAQVTDSTQSYISNIVSDDIFIDTVPPTGTASELPPETTTPVFDIPYTYHDPDPASGVADATLWYRKDGATWSAYTTQTPPTGTFSFNSSTTGGDGFYEFEVVAEDNAGNLETRTGIAETSTTVITSIAITEFTLADTTTGNTQFTDSAVVSAHIAVNDPENCAYMMLSENSDFSGATWIPYQQDSTFALSTGDGQKTVYAKVATAGYLESPPEQATIFLDTVPPSSSIFPLAETQTQAVFTINFTYSDPDPASGVEFTEIWYLRGTSALAVDAPKYPPIAFSTSGTKSKSTTISTQPPGWKLYATVPSPGTSVEFDSTTTGGDGFYQFVSVAQDFAENREAWSDTPDASTEVNTQPPKIGPEVSCITPNDDGINDSTGFSFPNPNNALAELTIYDRNLHQIYICQSNQPTWDASDSSGAVVPAGLYIFQIKVEGKAYNGSVLVAR
jgi:gliding motility-associated-like protein